MSVRYLGLAAAVMGGAAALVAGTGTAAAEETVESLAGAIDIAWLLIAGILVLFMQAGFGLVESGFIRSKNVTNILMKNALDLSFGAIAYWAVGWGLAYGTTEFIDIKFFGGGSFFYGGAMPTTPGSSSSSRSRRRRRRSCRARSRSGRSSRPT